MKPRAIGWIALIGACAAAGAAGAQQAANAAAPAPPKPGPHLLRLTNGGKGSITAVYVARAGTSDMSDDLLGSQTASVGRTVVLKVADPQGDCVFDIQFLMSNGSVITRKGVDLCQTSDVNVGP